MGVREKLIALEENAARDCTVTFSTCGDLRGAELRVENCRCIKELDDNFIVLSVCGYDIRVSGVPLTLENFGVGSVKITGVINALTFIEDRE